MYVDNWYSSPTLFANIFKNHTGACGTVGGRRTKMPCFRKILRKGQIEAYRNDALLAMKWKAKRDVRMLTTVHKPDIIDTEKTHHATGQIIRKPACVVDYSKHIGGVDKTDMQISLTECTRKTRKWYIKLFFHLVDMSLYNAYVLYKVNTGKKLQFVEFRKHIVEQIFEHHSTQLERTTSPNAVDNPNRLVGKSVLKSLLHKILLYIYQVGIFHHRFQRLQGKVERHNGDAMFVAQQRSELQKEKKRGLCVLTVT